MIDIRLQYYLESHFPELKDEYTNIYKFIIDQFPLVHYMQMGNGVYRYDNVTITIAQAANDTVRREAKLRYYFKLGNKEEEFKDVYISTVNSIIDKYKFHKKLKQIGIIRHEQSI